ncbi:MAG: NuoM family protein [bacterium]
MLDELSLVIFLPVIGAVVLICLYSAPIRFHKYLSFTISLATLGAAINLWLQFDPSRGAFALNLSELIQFEKNLPWISTLNIGYHIGLDGISLLLVMLTTFLTPLCIWGSFGSIKERQKGYYIAFLLLETGMLGVFSSLDLVLFYLFWEATLIPMYLLIGIWGGERRIYAAVKFILYTMVGSLLMLVGIIWIGWNSVEGRVTFDLLDLLTSGKFSLTAQKWLFLAFGLAFAIKVPLFPFHTWLPDAHTEAPTAGSIILAGILLKMGTYGFLRFCLPLFPHAAQEFSGWMVMLSLIGIIYGGLVTVVQKDIKRLIAYSSVSHLGFVMLGIFSFNLVGMQGGTIQMINHGLSTGALFYLVGVIYDRRHTRQISEYGGLAKVMPRYATLFMIVALSSIGLPGLNGFVGEFLILTGAFQVHSLYGIAGASGVVLAAVYLLWLYQRIFFGEVTHPENQNLPDLSLREKIILISMVVFIVWIGVHPTTWMAASENSVRWVITRVVSPIQ